MTIKNGSLQEICDLAAAQIQDLYPELQVMFLTHGHGQFQDIIATNEHEVLKHPAGLTAQSILEKNSKREATGLLGMAIHQERKWFGLSNKDHVLALINVNMDEFETENDARRTIYHYLWHAIDLMEVRQRPEYREKFKSGPMIPKRSPMNFARLNLLADIFSSTMSGLQGDEQSLSVLASERALNSLSPVHQKRAEDYPYVIAMDAAQYAYQELISLNPTKTKYMSYARQLTIQVGQEFDDKNILDWWKFSEPGQNMAWRDYPADIILACAIYTSDDPLVRATGHLVSEITEISPAPESALENIYNAYATSEQNQMLHRQIMEKTFEEAVARGVREESGRPLLSAANEQNENLADGIIMGWCANALQSAARAFDNALSTGASPSQAARMQFEGTKDEPQWEDLKALGDTAVEQKRKGGSGALGSIAEICANNPAIACVLQSVQTTMNDPNYIQKLAAANDLGIQPKSIPGRLTPKMPTPSAPVPVTPAFAPSAPGMGLGSGGGGIIRQQPARQSHQGGDDKKSR